MHIMHTMATRTQNCMVSLFRLRLMRVQVRHVTDRWLAVASACLAGRGRRFFFLQTRIAIPQYFSQSYGRVFLSTSYVHVHVHTRTVECLRDVNDILRHIKIRAIWLAEMQSSLAEKKNRARAWARCTWSVCSRLRLLRVQVRACHRPMTRRHLSARPA